jgi:hypothetical protein
MTNTQLDTLQQHACAVGDLAGEMLRYIDATRIADTYPAQILVFRQLLDECGKRAGLLIDLGNEIAGD